MCVLIAVCLHADNSLYNVTLNTSGLTGTTGDFVVDFISGGGPEQNAISIAGFTSDGTLGAASPTGDVFGTLPSTVILVDDPVNSAFNEYLTGFTFGTTISFFLDASENAPGAGSAPDEVSVYFLASDDMTSLVTTSDPTFSDALVTLDLDGSANGIPTVYDVSSPSTGVSADMTLVTQGSGGGGGGSPAPVPEPSSWMLAGGICGWLLRRKRSG
jgi:hypothetical protein